MTMTQSVRYFILIILLSVALGANASDQQFASGDAQVALVELYTSEGCSSCPPADRWLSSLESKPGLWRDFVPLAFHVDYWDYIGWKDRFASPEYSQRQRHYAHDYNEATVYTPGVRSNGNEMRGWRRVSSFQDEDAETVGELKVEISEKGAFKASFNNQSERNANLLNVALLGLDLESEVSRGENRGKKLQHDFVVLGISRYSSAESGEWSGVLPGPKVLASKYAVAVWVSDGRRVSPIQATGGYLSANISFAE